MLRIAKKMTKKAEHPFAFHGVTVVRGGAIQAVGYNHGWHHAEVNALNKLWPSKRKGCTVWSIRVTPGGRLASGKPCDKCEAYLKKNGIKTVYYSDEHGDIKRMKL